MQTATLRQPALPWALQAALILLLALACESAPTEIIVVVDSEFAIPDEVDRVEMLVTRQRDGRVVAEASVFLAAATTKFPVTFSLEQKDGDPGALTVDVQAKLRGQLVVLRRLNDVRFVAGAVMMLRMDIIRACRTPHTCPPPGPLTAWRGPPPAWPQPISPQNVDAAVVEADAGTVDADGVAPPAPDAGACTSDCKQTCAAGESCATTCPEGGDCSLSCSDDGTVCALESQAARATSVTCKKRARCSLKVAAAAKDGRAVCEDNAWCDVLCESPSCQLDCREAQCRLRTRAGAANTIITCTKKAECSLDIAAGSDNGIVCNGSSCSVMCRGEANCNVKCLGNATCTLTCSTSGACDLTNCPKPQYADCGSGVFVCGRACP